MRFSLKLAVLLAALPLTAAAQDAAKVDPAHYKVLVDNSAVRVLRISMPAGAKSVMHSHPDAMLMPLASAKARFTMPDGKTQDIELVKDTPRYTPAFTHLPANVGTTPVEAILVEFKGAAAGSATLPTSRPNAQMTSLAEGPRAVAFKLTLMPEFHEPAGSTHDYDQVVIALAATRHVARDRRPAARHEVEARRRSVHRPRRQARVEEPDRQAGRPDHRRHQVAAAVSRAGTGNHRHGGVRTSRLARRSCRRLPGRPGALRLPTLRHRPKQLGGEGGIRTPGRGFSPLQQISNLPCSATPAPLRGRLPASAGDEGSDRGPSLARKARRTARERGGGGRGTRTPKGREARELSRLLPYQLGLALRPDYRADGAAALRPSRRAEAGRPRARVRQGAFCGGPRYGRRRCSSRSTSSRSPRCQRSGTSRSTMGRPAVREAGCGSA